MSMDYMSDLIRSRKCLFKCGFISWACCDKQASTTSRDNHRKWTNALCISRTYSIQNTKTTMRNRNILTQNSRNTKVDVSNKKGQYVISHVVSYEIRCDSQRKQTWFGWHTKRRDHDFKSVLNVRADCKAITPQRLHHGVQPLHKLYREAALAEKTP